MPIDTFKYGKTATEVVIEHLIDEIKAAKPFIDDLTHAYCDRKCVDCVGLGGELAHRRREFG